MMRKSIVSSLGLSCFIVALTGTTALAQVESSELALSEPSSSPDPGREETVPLSTSEASAGVAATEPTDPVEPSASEEQTTAPTPSPSPVLVSESFPAPSQPVSTSASALMPVAAPPPIMSAQVSPTPASEVAQASSSTEKNQRILPIQLFNLETANQLNKNQHFFTTGFRWYPRRDGLDAGTGQQVFIGGFQTGITDKLQLGFNFFYHDDNLIRQVDGTLPNSSVGPRVRIGDFAPQVKYQLVNRDKLKISLASSIEIFGITSQFSVFTDNPNQPRDDIYVTAGGSVQAPITFSLAPSFQAHFTPGFSFLPNKVRGGDFYGTFFNLGAGLSWQPVRAFAIFGDLNYAVGPGGNALRSNDGEIVNRPVWSGGIRLTPPSILGVDLSFDFYATNALGTTLATRSLAQLPDSDQVSIAFNANFRFGGSKQRPVEVPPAPEPPIEAPPAVEPPPPLPEPEAPPPPEAPVKILY